MHNDRVRELTDALQERDLQIEQLQRDLEDTKEELRKADKILEALQAIPSK